MGTDGTVALRLVGADVLHDTGLERRGVLSLAEGLVQV